MSERTDNKKSKTMKKLLEILNDVLENLNIDINDVKDIQLATKNSINPDSITLFIDYSSTTCNRLQKGEYFLKPYVLESGLVQFSNELNISSVNNIKIIIYLF